MGAYTGLDSGCYTQLTLGTSTKHIGSYAISLVSESSLVVFDRVGVCVRVSHQQLHLSLRTSPAAGDVPAPIIAQGRRVTDAIGQCGADPSVRQRVTDSARGAVSV